MEPNLGALWIIALLGLWLAHRERNTGHEKAAANTARLYRGQLPQDEDDA
jgi:hypothetical protein